LDLTAQVTKLFASLTQVDSKLGVVLSPMALGTFVSREHVLSLADQTIVSATSFLVTFLIARWSDPTQLGIYALGLSVVMSVIGFQENLILMPYQVQRFLPMWTPAEHAGASLILSLLFSASTVFVLCLIAFGLMAWGANSETIAMALVVAAIVPFALVRDFTRRIAIARFDVGSVLLLDSAIAAIQLSILSWLEVSGQMSAVGACAALGAACALPTAGWLYHTRANFTLHLKHLPVVLAQTWEMGKWLLASRITSQLQGYAVYWLSVAIAGAAVTGVYAACMSVIGFANPLINGLSNIFLPKSVLAWEHGGGRALWQQTIRNTALLAVVLTAFTVLILFAGDQLMRFLYHDKEFAGHGDTLLGLALAISVGSLAGTASYSLAAMRRAQTVSLFIILNSTLAVILMWLSMTRWGLLGAAYAMLTANTIGAMAIWIVFYISLSKVSGATSGNCIKSCSKA
jgi:O-antigen/teichoic acid export membrane protein